MRSPVRAIVLKTLKIIGWSFLGLVITFCVAILVIRTPYAQNKLTPRVVSYLEGVIGTRVELQRIYVDFPKRIVIDGLYVEDQSTDTLLYITRVAVDTDLWSLKNRQIMLNSIELEGTTVKVSRGKGDTTFNFDYIIRAFSSSDSTEDKDAQAWTFSLGDIALSDIDLSFHDDLEGSHADVDLGALEVSLSGSDILQSAYRFSDITISNVLAEVSLFNEAQDNASTTNTNTSTNALDITFDQVQLNDIQLGYEQPGKSVDLRLGNMLVQSNAVNLEERIIDLKKVAVENTSVFYRQTSNESNEGEPSELADNQSSNQIDALPWSFALESFSLANSRLKYDNAVAQLTKGFDANHIWVFSLNAEGRDLVFKESQWHADFQQFSFREKGGFEMVSFQSLVSLEDDLLTVDNFEIKSRNSKVSVEGKAKLHLDSMEETEIEMNLSQSNIGKKDVLLFLPTFADSLTFQIPKNMSVAIDAKAHGKINNLVVENLLLKTLDSTVVHIRGGVKGLPEPSKIFLKDLEIVEISTTRNDLSQVLPDSTVSTSFQLPKWVSMKGFFSGYTKAAQIQLLLNSDAGKVDFSGDYNLSSTGTYDVVVSTSDFNVKKLMESVGVDSLTVNARVKGMGTSMENMDVLANVEVVKLRHNDYVYRDFELEGNVKENLFAGLASMEDDNLNFNLDAKLNFSQETPRYEVNLDLKNADLMALNFSQEPLRARGIAAVDLSSQGFKSINGDVSIRHFAIFNGEQLYKVDSLLFASIDKDGESTISINSDIATGNFEGTFNLLDMPKVLQQHVNSYFSNEDPTIADGSEPQKFKFELALHNTDLLTEIIFPELKSFVPGKIEGEFDSERKLLKVDVGITKIQYGPAHLDSVLLSLDSDDAAFNYKLRLKNLLLDSLQIAALQVQGQVSNQLHQAELAILDSLDQEKFGVEADISKLENGFDFRLHNDNLIINSKNWELPSDNAISYQNNFIKARNFQLSNGNELLTMTTSEADSTFVIHFSQFQLSNFTSLIEGAEVASGRLNGELKFNASKKGTFVSQLDIEKLSVMEREWGDAKISIAKNSSQYDAEIIVKGGGMDLTIDGLYNVAPSVPEFDVSINLQSLDMALAESLSFGNLSNAQGAVTAKLNVKGTLDQPSARGEVDFNKVSFKVPFLGNSFSLDKQKILLRDTDIILKDFSLKDEQSNALVVTGMISTTRFEKFNLDLTAKAKEFQVLNTKQSEESAYYGLVKLNVNAKITGNTLEPKIELSLGLSDETNLTYVVPESERSVMERKGIVRFVDKDAKTDPFLASLPDLDTASVNFQGLNLTANLELSDKALLNIVIDPRSGDKLSVNGNASLAVEVDPSGKLDISGRYEISKGSYDFSFQNLAKRKFDIQKGSNIVWSGDPLDASMDIKAEYRVETSPIDLVYNQINTSNQNEINSYNQRLPFLVYLILKGRLLAPDISFELDMPEDKRAAFGGAIYAKLQDINTRESDLNKQVFALLILKRFISDSPFESQATSTLNNTARRSVSRLLSEQLNRLSEKVEGVELTLDVKSYEDYSGGEVQGQTKAQLGVSKSLLDNRLVVKLSGNIDVENNQQSEFTDFIGDLALEYKITPDGRFRVTGFRNSNYDMIDGELTETGAGIIYVKDYNTLRELFKSNKKGGSR